MPKFGEITIDILYIGVLFVYSTQLFAEVLKQEGNPLRQNPNESVSSHITNNGCANCEAPLYSEAAFCHICGIKAPKKVRETFMRYGAIKVNENGKALVCPHCENEDVTSGDFCTICGDNIVNRCADTPDAVIPAITIKGCKTVLPGNARYCYKCGNESAFFQKGWLKDWKSENIRKAIRNVNVTIDLEPVFNNEKC